MDQQALARHKFLNWAQSILMLAGMVAVLALLGWLLGGWQGVIFTLIGAALVLIIGPRVSPKLILRMYQAHYLHPEQAPQLYAMLQELAARSALPRAPALYYVPSKMLNAFTVGNKQNAVVAVTDGLLRGLQPRELLGVLAHEVAHVRNSDTWVMGLGDMLSRITSTLSFIGKVLLLINIPLYLSSSELTVPWLAVLLLLFAPTLTALLQLALSRTREFDADLGAAELTGDPKGLAMALARLEQMHGGMLKRVFMPGRRNPDPSLLRSHPHTKDRIERLLALSGERLPKPVTEGLTARRFVLPAFAVELRPPGMHVSGLWY